MDERSGVAKAGNTDMKKSKKEWTKNNGNTTHARRGAAKPHQLDARGVLVQARRRGGDPLAVAPLLHVVRGAAQGCDATAGRRMVQRAAGGGCDDDKLPSVRDSSPAKDSLTHARAANYLWGLSSKCMSCPYGAATCIMDLRRHLLSRS